MPCVDDLIFLFFIKLDLSSGSTELVQAVFALVQKCFCLQISGTIFPLEFSLFYWVKMFCRTYRKLPDLPDTIIQ